MKCPGCEQKMKHKSYKNPDKGEKYTRPSCGIKNKNGNWKIPAELRPTEKQERTILFINERLGMDLEALTKRQCQKDIGKYF